MTTAGGAHERLQKLLAAAGVASRRHAELLIRQGRVTVNGERAELGMKATVDDDVRVDGVRVGPQAPRYVVLNKPTGVVTTASDPQGRKTVVSLVSADERIFPVGRLDMDTSGLLLLTNDGDLANRLMHPSHEVGKTYHALVDGTVSNEAVQLLRKGVELEDGVTAPAQVRVLQHGRATSLVELTIHEGRNRQVRRMLEVVGFPVQQLARVQYGPLKLGSLRVGEHRDLTPAEIRKLQKAAGIARPRTRRTGDPDQETAENTDDEIAAEGEGGAAV